MPPHAPPGPSPTKDGAATGVGQHTCGAVAIALRRRSMHQLGLGRGCLVCVELSVEVLRLWRRPAPPSAASAPAAASAPLAPAARERTRGGHHRGPYHDRSGRHGAPAFKRGGYAGGGGRRGGRGEDRDLERPPVEWHAVVLLDGLPSTKRQGSVGRGSGRHQHSPMRGTPRRAPRWMGVRAFIASAFLW